MSRVGVAGIPARSLTSPNSSVPPFGIYRLAIPEWQMYAYQSLKVNELIAREYLRGVRGTSKGLDTYELNSTYALTYVERRDTSRREDLDDIQFAQVLERIGNLASNSQVEAISIGGLEWMGRHIVAAYDQDSAEYQRLLDQQAEVTRILGEAGMGNPPVYRPHHTSLSGFRFEGYTVHKSLQEEHRATLVSLMSARLTQAGIDSVELGETIVGRGYIDPYTADTWQADVAPVGDTGWVLDYAS